MSKYILCCGTKKLASLYYTGCGKIKDPTLKTAISVKRHNNFK